ncbi:hypothetical protein Zmor_001422 [Zophobas morio]|uniref:Uncharacterized protein n=1 Tax=Zophobas morio TaxID=2755281 RepID=A0AA38IV33_9CUCU|nr:hypothetical protein Zmor_014622 [Zophobas morio]KAJ3660881.1 hypothetical protein Zmor_005310 [Zophobas morio]KAJ3661404.1 hypothetical protein Zmor_005800 [Zophobas morio]KAJ3665960.1 hypothetical protein Zmor_001422 [Zophobas morio]
MNEENCEIPENIVKKAQKANENVLPGTSGSIYEKEYKIFLNWKIKKWLTSKNCQKNIHPVPYGENTRWSRQL